MDISGRESESLVVRALYSTEGAQCLADTYTRLRRMIERRRFNLERASAMYMFSVDAAVWKHLRGHPLRRIMYRNYLISDDGPRHGRELARGFALRTSTTDQCRPRRWLKPILGP